MERIESAHSLWLFDTERMRFRRLPRGADPDAPSLDTDWQEYYGLEVDEESGSFTVALNEEGTRLLRSWRVPPPRDDATREVTLEADRADG